MADGQCVCAVKGHLNSNVNSSFIMVLIYTRYLKFFNPNNAVSDGYILLLTRVFFPGDDRLPTWNLEGKKSFVF